MEYPQVIPADITHLIDRFVRTENPPNFDCSPAITIDDQNVWGIYYNLHTNELYAAYDEYIKLADKIIINKRTVAICYDRVGNRLLYITDDDYILCSFPESIPAITLSYGADVATHPVTGDIWTIERNSEGRVINIYNSRLRYLHTITIDETIYQLLILPDDTFVYSTYDDRIIHASLSAKLYTWETDLWFVNMECINMILYIFGDTLITLDLQTRERSSLIDFKYRARGVTFGNDGRYAITVFGMSHLNII